MCQRCERKAKEKKSFLPASLSNDRRANYCDVSVGTVKRVRQERKHSNTCRPLRISGKQRHSKLERNSNLDGFGLRVAKRPV